MATGKTSVGKALAKRLKRQFADIDELIELRQKRTISDIFTKYGEPYFRKVEKETLKQAATEDSFIYACGGGIVLDKDNLQTMKQTGKIICLTARPQTILNRVGKTSYRPLLAVPDPKKQIDLLLKLRQPFYTQADKTIDTTKLSVGQVVTRILKII